MKQLLVDCDNLDFREGCVGAAVLPCHFQKCGKGAWRLFA